MNTVLRIFVIVLLLPCLLLPQVKRTPDITAAELQLHVNILASDSLEGRKAGTPGGTKAAHYIASEFASCRLQPLGDNGTFLQKFEFTAEVTIGPSTAMHTTIDNAATELRSGTDYRPLSFSSSGAYNGPVVFAGFGIVNREKTYNDYNGLDVKGKAVLMFRGSPEQDSSHPNLGEYRGVRYKALKARELGASLLIMVNNQTDSEVDSLMKFEFDNSFIMCGIPAVTVSRATADRLLKETGKSALETLQSLLAYKTASCALNGPTVDVKVEINEVKATGINVVGFLPGADTAFGKEYIVFGAHYDHLGYGGPGSLEPGKHVIHYGADDNASGTSGLMELAQYFADRRNTLKRGILFIAFTGEELGLLGSAHYAEHPTLPLNLDVAMLNMDMIGRLSDRALTIFGTGTSPGFEKLLSSANTDSTFVLSFNKEGFGPSDQSSFYSKKVPVLHFFTGTHTDYHRSSDTPDRINAVGMRQVVEYIARVGGALDEARPRPAFTQADAPKMAGGGRGGARVYTGTVPDFGGKHKGYKISAVRDNSPAAKAGLKGGDIIVKFGRIEINSIDEYMYALNEYKPGDEVELVVQRGEERLTMKMVLGKRD